MTNEADIPNFPKTFEQFKSSQPQGIPVADRKYSGVLLKRLAALAKSGTVRGNRRKAGNHSRTSGRAGKKTQALVSSNKLTFHHNSPKFY